MKFLALFAKALILLMLCIGASVLSLKFLPAPWAWIYFFLIITVAWFIWRTKNRNWRLALVYLGIIPAVLLVMEVGSWIMIGNIVRTETNISGKFATRSDVLGYAPLPNAVRQLRLSFKNETIFDVKYSINNDSLRYTPASSEKSNKCILLFGGSYAFGWGLEDSETFLNVLGRQLGNQYRLLNFGYNAYGPHQMLSAIEQGFVADRIKGCKSSLSIYMAIPSHVGRAAGYYWWDSHGPRYELINNQAVLTGNFDSESRLYRRVRLIAMATMTLSPVFKRLFIGYESTTIDDRHRYLRIVDKARQYLENITPEARFIAVLYDADNSRLEALQRESRAIIKHWSDNQYEFYLAGDILKGYREDPSTYFLHHMDRHPNSQAVIEMANHIAAHLR